MKALRVFATVAAAVVLSTGAANAAVHAGDKLAISVYNHPELATQAVIDAQGEVSMSLVGLVDTRGADPKQLADRIKAKLSRYMRYPAVDVVVLSQSQTVRVAGGPGGMLQYNPGETLGSALTQLQVKCACVLKDGPADLQHIKIVRDDQTLGPFDAVALASGGETGPDVLPGDTISLPNKPIAVIVRGEVKSPGTAYLAADQPLSQAIAQVGGVTANASSAQMLLQRSGEITQVAEGSPEFAASAHNGDTITVPSAEHIQVVGQVGSPGEITLKQDFTLLSALYLAGGPTKWGDIRKVEVLHRGTKHTYNVAALQHGNLSQNPGIEDGDVVYVPEGHAIDWRSLFQDITFARWFTPNGRL
ncbi:MAG: polysaccharide biosynthesis/export family protein [Vulcanimicrobiaceae bacterium]